eukprot:2112725-Rhodomonas_salina.1
MQEWRAGIPGPRRCESDGERMWRVRGPGKGCCRIRGKVEMMSVDDKPAGREGGVGGSARSGMLLVKRT